MVTALLYARGARRSRQWPAWRTALFLLGLLTVLIALSSQVDEWAHELFSAHMTQHMALTLVAAPLLLLGAPILPLTRGIPRALRVRVFGPIARNGAVRTVTHGLRNPLVAGILYVGGLYYWHIPQVYDAAVGDQMLHSAQHLWFLLTSLLFWSGVIDPLPFRSPLPYPARIIYLLLAGAAQNTILGGILAFSTRLIYRSYDSTPLQYGMDPLTDQRIGGAIMWVPGDVIFLAGASFAFFRWLATEEEDQRRRELAG